MMRSMSARRSLTRWIPLTFGLAVLACAKPSETNPPGDSESAAASAEGGQGSAEAQHGLLPNASVLEGSHGMYAPNTEGVLRSNSTGESSYDASAPATVLVTTRWGHGSGVIIDPSGLVLTNYHVIESGQDEDFNFRVKVTTVDIQANGSVKPGAEYDAVALKVDPKRDLALLRIEGAPDKLASAPLAKGDPKPGRRVAAIGNAGVGFGWAVKHCNINAIGTLESRAAAIFHLHGETWTEEEREEMAEIIAKAAEEAGLQIQTDCTILPGDSGGPLIDEETHELVGLNLSVMPAVKQSQELGSVAYHVHVSELREFTQDIPKDPVTWIPDPWEVAGSEGSLVDSDGDGELDSLLVIGPCNESMICHALFADVDQDSFGSGEIPSLDEIYEQRSLDAEFIAFNHARLPRGSLHQGGHVVPINDLLMYFDRDNDGTLETLVVFDGETGTHRAYKGLGGTISRDTELEGQDDIGAEVFNDADLQVQVERFSDAFGGPESGDPRAPARTAAIEVRFDDHSGDGTADTLYAQTRLDVRLLMDVDQDSIAALGDNKHASEALSAGTIDAEFMAVSGTPMKVWYDTDSDGAFDLLLVGPSLERGVVVEATSYTPDGKGSPAPQHIGRRMLRPGLLANEAHAVTLEKMFTDAFPEEHAAVDDMLSSFPSIAMHEGSFAFEVEGSSKGAAQVIEFDRVMLFADLDRNTFKGKETKNMSVDEALRAGKFEAEFIYVYDGLMAWAYYDTDNDGSFETVLVSRSGDPLHAEEVFTLAKDLTWDTPSDETPMFDSDRFRKSKKQRKAFAAFEKLVLDPEVMDEAR